MLDLSHIMPDSEGINFYTADPDLSFLLSRNLSLEDNDRAQGILTEMGAVASRKMDELAGVANRQGPVLVQYDKRGQRIDEVVFHPAYHELERIAYQDFAIAACTIVKVYSAGRAIYLSRSNLLSVTLVCRRNRVCSVPYL